MSIDRPLAGTRIAVLVESEYIPAEIAAYRDGFAALGAEVDLVGHLWGEPSLTFRSTATDEGAPHETLTVDKDLAAVDFADYAALIVAANYVSVRARWFQPPEGRAPTAAMIRSAPAVAFFARALRDRRLIKAAPCHALWLVTPVPELLAGRRVTCNPVVLADVVNTGAIHVPVADGEPWDHQVVVDDDLVTTPSARSTDLLIAAVRDAILARRARPAAAPAPVPATHPATAPSRRILVLVSEWGYWGEELVAPIEEFDAAGYGVDVVTPTGRRPNAIAVSWDPDYVDPPLGRPVTSPEMAAKVARWDDPTTPEGARLDHPIDLSAWFPEQPYWSAPNVLRAFEAYEIARERAAERVGDYDALLIVGGSGPIVDLANNRRVHDLVLAFHRAGKPIGAECYGVAALAFARDRITRTSLLAGKRVTGHCLEYDYKAGTGFMKARGTFLDFDMGPPPYPLEFILRDATLPDGAYIGNFGRETSVIVDFPFVTGRSTPDSRLTGRKLIEMLDGSPPLRRWGW